MMDSALKEKCGKRYSKRNYNCIICNKKISDKNYAISRHVKEHNISLYDYIRRYYKLSDGEFCKCSFCEREAIPIFYEIDHINKTYKINYNNGYSCKTQECKNNISLDILGCEYDSKKFEKIGSRCDYLSKLYKISIDESKKLKYNKPKVQFKCTLEHFKNKYGHELGETKYYERTAKISKNSARNKFPCTLSNFIQRYGIEIGTKKYNNRCERISYTSSKDFFIDKYGQEKADEIWKNKYKQPKISKKSSIINNILTELNIDFEVEKNISSKFVDYYLTDYNIVIEYFGDYWHANPKRFKSDSYISQLQMYAGELWVKDKERLDKIKQNIDSIIVIWESTIMDGSILEKTINDIKNKKIIIYL